MHLVAVVCISSGAQLLGLSTQSYGIHFQTCINQKCIICAIISSSLQVLKTLPSKAEFSYKGGKYFYSYFTGGQIKAQINFLNYIMTTYEVLAKKKERIWINRKRTVFFYRYLKYSLLHVLLQKNPNKMFGRKDGEI